MMISRYPIKIPGFGKQRIELEISGFLGKNRILLNGIPAEKGHRKDEYILYQPDGVRVSAQLQSTFFDAIPKVIVQGEAYDILPPLTWYQYVFAGLSLILVLYGGGYGGLLGMISFLINIRLLRNSYPRGLRLLLILFMNMLAFFIFTMLSRNLPDFFLF
jgi:hypothetical protein